MTGLVLSQSYRRSVLRALGYVCLIWGVLVGAACAAPALWLAQTQQAKIYLFGTLHVLPKDEVWMTQAVQQAFNSADELWIETDVSNLPAVVKALRQYGLNAQQDPESLLPEKYRSRFRAQISQSGVSAALVAHAQPWLAEVFLSMSAMGQTTKLGLGVEANLMQQAATRHMKMRYFETLESQFTVFSKMPAKTQLASLEAQIDEFDSEGENFQQLLAAWRAGDQAKLYHDVDQAMHDRDESVWRTLIVDRSRNFADQIRQRLRSGGTAFVAVGAGHLCGAEGVPNLLRQHGIQVTRIQ